MKNLLPLALFAMVCTAYARVCEPKCTPSDLPEFENDCTVCFCTEDGNIACTDKPCLPPPPEEEYSKICEPGTTYPRDCNTCTCNEYGTREFCTERACAAP